MNCQIDNHSEQITLCYRPNNSKTTGQVINIRLTFTLYKQFSLSIFANIEPSVYLFFLKTMVTAKKFIYAKRFEGLPKVTDFRLEEEILPDLKDGGKSICLI